MKWLLFIFVLSSFELTFGHQKCSELFQVSNKFKSFSIRDIKDRHTFRWLELHQPEAKEQIREFHESLKKPTPLFEVGQQIEISGNSVQIAGYLGAGGSGAVYLVRIKSRGNSLYAMKVFGDHYGLSTFKDHLYHHNRDNAPSKATFPGQLPRVVSSDSLRNAIIFEYKIGIPINYIEKMGFELGFSREQTSSIIARYKKLRYSDGGSRNIIYSASEDNFYLIDPN
jgi:hypothetical protein